MRSALLLLALLLAGCSTPSPAPPAPGLPDISLARFEGGESVHVRQLEKPVVINFWASWCDPCRAELPAFQKLADQKKVAVIGVNTDDRRAAAESIITDLGLGFPMLQDETGELRRALGEPNLPLTIFVDATGKVTRYVGPALTEAKLADLVAERLGVK